MARATRPSGRGLPITTSSTSRSVRSFATASSSGTRPFIGTSEEEVTMIRPGTGHVLARTEHRVVDADRHHRHPRSLDAHLRRDVRLRGFGHRDHPWQGACHPHLHAQEPEPSQLGEVLPRVRRMAERELAVDGDRVVQRGEQRPAVVDHPEDAVAEALVVVDEVEVAGPVRQQPAGAQREGPRFGKPRRAHHPELEGGDRRRVEVGEPRGDGIRNGSGSR